MCSDVKQVQKSVRRLYATTNRQIVLATSDAGGKRTETDFVSLAASKDAIQNA